MRRFNRARSIHTGLCGSCKVHLLTRATGEPGIAGIEALPQSASARGPSHKLGIRQGWQSPNEHNGGTVPAASAATATATTTGSTISTVARVADVVD
jgi:hypothetical protein